MAAVLTMSRVDRIPRTYDLGSILGGVSSVPGGATSVQVALLPVHSGPDFGTIWTSVTYASGSFDVLLVGPDADSTGALVVPGDAELWMKVSDAPLVEAVKIERIVMLGGGPNLPAAPLYVGSVNGKTGVVTLTPGDVGAVSPNSAAGIAAGMALVFGG